MEQIIAVFASRTESMRFSEFLTRNGIANNLVNTPRDLSLGCGISVAVDIKYLDTLRYLLTTYPNRYSYKGIYKLSRIGIRTITQLL